MLFFINIPSQKSQIEQKKFLKKIFHEKGWDREGWQIVKSEEVAKQKAKESISEAARIGSEDSVYLQGSKGAMRAHKVYVICPSEAKAMLRPKWDGSPVAFWTQ